MSPSSACASAIAWCSPLGGLRDGDDEDEVEEELERRRRAVRLVRRPRAHRGVDPRTEVGPACRSKAESNMSGCEFYRVLRAGPWPV